MVTTCSHGLAFPTRHGRALTRPMRSFVHRAINRMTAEQKVSHGP